MVPKGKSDIQKESEEKDDALTDLLVNLHKTQADDQTFSRVTKASLRCPAATSRNVQTTVTNLSNTSKTTGLVFDGEISFMSLCNSTTFVWTSLNSDAVTSKHLLLKSNIPNISLSFTANGFIIWTELYKPT